MSRITDWINSIAAITAACAAVAIPFVIDHSQSNLAKSFQAENEQTTSILEAQNRKVGIAQILSDNYEVTCKKRLAIVRLVEDWLINDPKDKAIIYRHLEVTEEKDSCSTEEKNNINTKREEIKGELLSILPEGNVKLLLSPFRIGIHFLDENEELKYEANELKSALIEKGIDRNKIIINGKSKQWFDKTGGLSSDQIRYEENSEREIANALDSVLKQVYPRRSFKLQPIRGKSLNYISIFLK